MIATILISLVLIFAALKLGAVGVLAYNLIRLFVGSLAYLAILATFFFHNAFKWLDKHEGVISGFLSFFVGVLLMFQAFFVSSLHLDNNGIKVTFSRIMADLIHLRVESFAGGGMIGALLYAPISFLFSNIGSYFIVSCHSLTISTGEGIGTLSFIHGLRVLISIQSPFQSIDTVLFEW